MSRDDRFLDPGTLAARYDDVLQRSETTELAPDEWDAARSRAEDSEWGVGGFVTRNRRVLLVRQGRRWDESETWVAPGGLLEVGETHAEGAVRETREETGLTIEIDGLAAINEQRFLGEDGRCFEFRFAMFDATTTTTELAADPGLGDEDIRGVEWFDSLPENTYERELLASLRNRTTESETCSQSNDGSTSFS